mmetsp:Transcript_49282/g.111811  ORF Transcript_49282/g.111811 Transcript_49282/m.111811 type:complete len:224 (-) Transcript_49282:43-714(-)
MEPLLSVELLLPPLEKLFAFGLHLDPVPDRRKDDEEAEEALRRDGVRVDEAREEDAQDDASVHHDGEHHGAEAADGLEDKNLADGVPDAEEHHVHVHVRVVHQKRQEGREFLGVHERDGREDEREGVHHEHHVGGRQRVRLLEHVRLPLPRERVEDEEEAEQEQAAEGAAPRLHPPLGVQPEGHVLGRDDEHGDPEPDHECDGIFVGLVRIVPEEAAHQHDRS